MTNSMIPPNVLKEAIKDIKFNWVGKPVKRKEDLRFLKGKGNFVDDISIPGCLYIAFARSKVAHAIIRSIDVEKARSIPGVKLVLTGTEISKMMKPWPHLIPVPPFYGIAVDKVRYQGEPIAMVVAEDRYVASDAAELIELDYELLEPVTSIEKAIKPSAPLIHEEFKNNIAWHKKYEYGDVEGDFSRSSNSVKGRFYYHRFISSPLEPTSLTAVYDRVTGRLTIYDQNQQAPMYHARYSRVLGLPSNKIRIVVPDLGGGFGNKQSVYPYTALVALASMITGRPAKYTASRTEDLQALMHSPDRLAEAELAYNRDGEIYSFKMKLYDNFGAYLRHPDPQNVTRAFPSILGPYRIKSIQVDAYGVFTNTCPTGPNRGYGQQHAAFVLERLVDKMAYTLGMDVADVRIANMVKPEEMPYTTPLGSVYDGGNYPLAMKNLLEYVDYHALRIKQETLKNKGVVMGIGVAAIVEGGATAFGFARLWGGDPRKVSGYASMAESAFIRILPDGTALVALGTVPQGQGHETVVSQIVADILGISLDDVNVMPGFDSDSHPYSAAGSGTYASRFSQIAVGAVVGAAIKIRQKIIQIAAHHLEANPNDIMLENGIVFVKGQPDNNISIKEIARIAHTKLGDLPPETEGGLEAFYTYYFPYSGPVGDDLKGNLCSSYSFLGGVAVVLLDPETGNVKVDKITIVHDSGRALNPMILDGQIQGAVVNGLAGALFEGFEYDENGNMLTSTYVDYLPISSADTPNFELLSLETYSPFTVLGAKGSGEGGTILLPVLISNAVNDALRLVGRKEIETSRIKPHTIWQLIHKN